MPRMIKRSRDMIKTSTKSRMNINCKVKILTILIGRVVVGGTFAVARKVKVYFPDQLNPIVVGNGSRALQQFLASALLPERNVAEMKALVFKSFGIKIKYKKGVRESSKRSGASNG